MSWARFSIQNPPRLSDHASRLAFRQSSQVHVARGFEQALEHTIDRALVPVAREARCDQRIVDAPMAKEGCAEQTWPYIEARCLTRAANNAAPLANTAPSESAPPVAPSASAPQVVPSAPQIAVAEPVAPVRSKTLPSDPQPTARDAANTSVVMTADARAATIAGPAAAGLAMTSLAAVEEPESQTAG